MYDQKATRKEGHAKIHEPWYTVRCKFLLIFVSLIYDFISLFLCILHICFYEFNEKFNSVTSKDTATLCHGNQL